MKHLHFFVALAFGLLATAGAAAEQDLEPLSTFKDCDQCPEMVVLPAGDFLMGSPENEPQRGNREGPQHQVRIERPFAIGRYEVTLSEWDACVVEGGCVSYVEPDERVGQGLLPADAVSWSDAKAFVSWLAEKTGQRYRLPSEAEWEYAARA